MPKISTYEHVEEIRLDASRRSFDYLMKTLPEDTCYQFHESYIFPSNYNYLYFSLRLAKTHLINVFGSFPAEFKLIYVGANENILLFLKEYFRREKKSLCVYVPKSLQGFYSLTDVQFIDEQEILEKGYYVLCDFSTESLCQEEFKHTTFDALPERDQVLLLAVESAMIALAHEVFTSNLSKKFIVFNSLRNRFDSVVTSLFNFTLTPFSSRLRICELKKGLKRGDFFKGKLGLRRAIENLKRMLIRIYCRSIKIDVPS